LEVYFQCHRFDQNTKIEMRLNRKKIKAFYLFLIIQKLFDFRFCFVFDLFLEARAEILSGVLVEIMTQKGYFEIN
jgi:hypothetical protein